MFQYVLCSVSICDELVPLSSSTSREVLIFDCFTDGVIYTRWGRTICPETATLVYEGVCLSLCLSLRPLHLYFLNKFYCWIYLE